MVEKSWVVRSGVEAWGWKVRSWDVLNQLELFNNCDKNGDGLISHDELKEVLKDVDVNLTDQEISEMIEAVDLDGDGQINFEEYKELNAMMNYRLLH